MKVLVLALAASTAAAFAPASTGSTTSTGSATQLDAMSMDNMRGSINFFRKEFKFDPLKLSETYQPLLPYMRDAEIHNARTAMLAVPGLIVPEYYRLPGDAYSFENVPRVMDAPEKLGFGVESPMFQLIFWIGMWEVCVAGPAAFAAHKGERAPGGTCSTELYC